jgi:hypothetical protein
MYSGVTGLALVWIVFSDYLFSSMHMESRSLTECCWDVSINYPIFVED